MKLVVLALMILALSCSHTAPLVSNVSNLSPTAVEEKLGITVQKDENERYSGYYSSIVSSGGKETLNGPFELKYENKVSYPEEGDIVTKIVYSGRYVNGSKAGSFVEDLLYDDNVDIYAEWKATLFYEPDSERCSGGQFEGRTYEREWSYEESPPEECTFGYMVKKGYEELEKIFQKTLQQTKESVKRIGTSYEETIQNLSTFRHETRDLVSNAPEGAAAQYYYDGSGSLSFIRAIYFGETGKTQHEFLYEKEALIYCRMEDHLYNVPFYVTRERLEEMGMKGEAFDPEKTKVLSEHYYFDDRSLVEWIDQSGNVKPTGIIEFPEKQEAILKMSNELVSAGKEEAE